jgi:hypothetical protein
MRAVTAPGLLALLVSWDSALAATTMRLDPASGGYDLVVETDTQLDVVTAGIRTADGCSDCAFVWDDQRLLDRGLQDARFLEPGPGGKVGLQKLGSFAAPPAPGLGVDFLTVQGTTLLGGAFGSREGPLNLPGETSFRLGTVLTASSVSLVQPEELVPLVGDLLVSAFPTGPDRDADGVGNAADNCLFTPNGAQVDSDLDGIGDACECGDVNGDGFTNTVDALAIARGEVSGGQPSCDVDGDGLCNTVDALKIARGEVTPADQFDQVCPAAGP